MDIEAWIVEFQIRLHMSRLPQGGLRNIVEERHIDNKSQNTRKSTVKQSLLEIAV